MVVRFGEYTNRAPQNNLQVRGLQLAVGEVRCELQAALDVVRVFLSDSPALNLNRDTQ